MKEKVRINREIRAEELRVVDDAGVNLGILPLSEAIKRAEEAKLDLIEISPNATPPIAKIMDYGRFQYIAQKKERDARAKAHVTETKTIQIKIGTSERDLELKAKKTSDWLKEGHRVKLNLFLPGRAKYLEQKFLAERMDRILRYVSVDYRVAEPPQKSPKGLTVVIERSGKVAVAKPEGKVSSEIHT